MEGGSESNGYWCFTTDTNFDADIPISDVHGSAQSRKPAEAEPKKAEPAWAVATALQGPRLRVWVKKAVSRGISRGFW